MKFPFYRQLNKMDCGIACLKMISKFHGKSYSIDTLRQYSNYSRSGVSLHGISQAAEKLGLKTMAVEIDFETLINKAPLPCIVYWKSEHFVVVTPKSNSKTIIIADPAQGIIDYSPREFLVNWTNNSPKSKGLALLLETTPEFLFGDEELDNKVGWSFFFGYVRQYKKYLYQIFFSLILISLIQLIFPFLTQSIVDTGIVSQNIGFIKIILLAQLMLFAGRTMIEFIRGRLFLYVSSRISIQVLSGFWIKLMKLPISYFDSRQSGDIIQRIGDQHRIQNFITSSSFSAIFSALNLLVFSIVLLYYNLFVFLVFLAGGIAYFLWIGFFMKQRRKLDFKKFELGSKENDITMQLIHGMQEIKLNNAEIIRRWEWEKMQIKLFKLNNKALSVNQFQQAGAFFINEGKNIFITFIVAKMVIDGKLTLGTMLAIQYIIGQLSGPIEQLITFFQSAQDAKISLERLNEIHKIEDEESSGKNFISIIPEDKSIRISDLTFAYPGTTDSPVLQSINLEIPQGKVTAIVGMSGSGKTTLIKLLLQFYQNYAGTLEVGNVQLKTINPSAWRNHCGSVMQNGYIFNDTIANNIAVNVENPNTERLIYSCKIANILNFIDKLPLGFNTKIGTDGYGISQGQRQRILIARAIYKNPDYLFFDEATNSLDANNESIILDNLKGVFAGRTVVVVAHRLSTVRDADQIIVLDNGIIKESGNHEELVAKGGLYYTLIKNQLELGNS